MSPYHGSDEKIINNDSLGIESSDVDLESGEGRSHISSAKTKDLFNLDLMNSISKYCRVMIHLEYLPPQQLT